MARYLGKRLNLIKEEIKMLSHNEILKLIDEFKKISLEDIVSRNSYLTQEEINEQLKELVKNNNIKLIEKEMQDAYDFLTKKDDELTCFGVDEKLGQELENQMYKIKINALNKLKDNQNVETQDEASFIEIEIAINNFLNTKEKTSDIREITFRSVLKDFLEYCNKNEVNFVQNLTFPFIMQFKNDYHKEKGIKKGTINNYLIMVRLFLTYCKKAKYINFDFEEDIIFTITKKEQRENKREPFTKEDIKQIFENLDLIRFTPTQRESKYINDYEMIIKIGIFSGLRINEICQLRKKDIKIEDGIWFFDINDEGEKHLKNENSIRKVPIHKNILEEFLDFIKNKNGNIFDIKEEKMSKDFGIFKTKLGFNEKKVFHSFRHFFQNELKQKEVNYQIIQEIVGHSEDEDHKMTNTYTKSYKLQVLKENIDKLDFKIGEV
ncbi:site-specific integrase [Aliarcobacter cryaerophilus]|uniref:site-specific integrase n=1 Tax=Aliarcobacter cryaerophilus TaxID=28198 RepID=UPI0015E85253|nr:site-specific integrase [Aliarcobacter cryaerophilus]